ncbi:MAG: hypothetical protein M3237_00010 [Actinomycetota bacterium]|nr:hypothetical protein [Actinomycetota bacterium]
MDGGADALGGSGWPASRHATTRVPGSASAALTQVSLTDQEYLQAWQGGLVLAGYDSSWPRPGA